MNELKENYEKAVQAYIDAFAEKQELDFDYWVADEVGGIACFGDYYFNIHEIVLDINTEQPKGMILKWQNDGVDNPDKVINYKSYTMGLRHRML